MVRGLWVLVGFVACRLGFPAANYSYRPCVSKLLAFGLSSIGGAARGLYWGMPVRNRKLRWLGILCFMLLLYVSSLATVLCHIRHMAEFAILACVFRSWPSLLLCSCDD